MQGEDHWRTSIFLREIDTVTNKFIKRVGICKKVSTILAIFRLKEVLPFLLNTFFSVDLSLHEAEMKVARAMIESKSQQCNIIVLQTIINPDILPNKYKFLHGHFNPCQLGGLRNQYFSDA